MKTRFVYNCTEKDVRLTGSFNEWKSKIPMTEVSDGFFVLELDLRPGTYSYKFVVNGSWLIDPEKPSREDQFKNVNNYVVVEADDSVDALESFDAGCYGGDPQDEQIDHFARKPEDPTEYGIEVTAPPRRSLSACDLVSLSAVSCEFGSKCTLATDAAETPTSKLAICTVGLPGRGKSFISHKVARHLKWMGYECKRYNVGEYRRERVGAHQEHSFFAPENPQGRDLINQMAFAALKDMVAFLQDGGHVGIYDAANTTSDRRNKIVDYCTSKKIQVLFVECVCNDSTIIEANFKQMRKNMPDYKDMSEEDATRDFIERINHYKSVYETMEKGEGHSFIKVVDVGTEIICHRLSGYLPCRVLNYLANLNTTPRPLYFTRHGESEYNVKNLIGGNSLLSPKGELYAIALAEWVEQLRTNDPGDAPMFVWTSTLRRTIATARHIQRTSQPVKWRCLDEINAGRFDGYTYQQIADEDPKEYKARLDDKLGYRYPQGESYQDLIHRLEPVLFELERQPEPVLVVAHQAILRVLLGYLMNKDPQDCPTMNIPLHEVMEIRPGAYQCEIINHKLLGKASKVPTDGQQNL